jgi:predicted HAD superfamily Cof-like phosphohydrolase
MSEERSKAMKVGFDRLYGAKPQKLGIDIGRVIINGDGPDTSFLHANDQDALSASAVPGAFESIARLVAMFGADRVWLVSKCGANVERKTRGWLIHHRFYEQTGVLEAHLRFCLKRPDKAVICEELGVTHFVDDRQDVLDAMRGKVKHRFLFSGSWPPVEEAILESLRPSLAVGEWTKAEIELPPGACGECGGEGQIQGVCATSQENPEGVYAETCESCKGSGLARNPIREQVIAFHKKFVPDQGIGEGPPRIPSEEMVRFRLQIVMEEAFELLYAIIPDEKTILDAKQIIAGVITNGRLDVDLPAVMDALGDLDSVIEGTRLAFQVDGRPIADAIFRSNCSKTAPTAGAHKLVKGPGYFPPDVAGELKKQGWTGEVGEVGEKP